MTNGNHSRNIHPEETRPPRWLKYLPCRNVPALRPSCLWVHSTRANIAHATITRGWEWSPISLPSRTPNSLSVFDPFHLAVHISSIWVSEGEQWKGERKGEIFLLVDRDTKIQWNGNWNYNHLPHNIVVDWALPLVLLHQSFEELQDHRTLKGKKERRGAKMFKARVSCPLGKRTSASRTPSEIQLIPALPLFPSPSPDSPALCFIYFLPMHLLQTFLLLH